MENNVMITANSALENMISNDNERMTVNGRQLHEFLEVETPYAKWFSRMCDYGFLNNVDYTTVDKKVLRADGTEMPQTKHDHLLTVDMAKQLCMLQRNEKGKIARQYFIEIEKAWNNPEAVMIRALNYANKRLEELKTEVLTMKPKAEYFDCLVDRNLLTNFRTTAKEFHIKQKQFINWLLEKKFVYRDQKGNLQPYSQYADYFHVKDSKSQTGKWAGTQTLITPKGKEAFRLLLGKD